VADGGAVIVTGQAKWLRTKLAAEFVDDDKKADYLAGFNATLAGIEQLTEGKFAAIRADLIKR
jgi:hypothetical protein